VEGGVELNQSCVTFVSDRSRAITSSVHHSAPAANHHYCPLHLVRNLKTNGCPRPGAFWSARNAVSESDYNKVMNKMKIDNENMYKYLNSIENWQVYKSIERGNKLFAIKSSNIVEAVCTIYDYMHIHLRFTSFYCHAGVRGTERAKETWTILFRKEYVGVSDKQIF
jgi:hypothetical protein